MADETEKMVEDLLLEGRSRQEIWKKLKEGENKDKILFHINNNALPRDRKKYQYLNLLLATALLFMTAKKLIVAFSLGSMDISFFLSLVVPAVNIYVLREILRFHRVGYQFLFFLSVLSLTHPDNHKFPELALLAVMIVLSGLFYLHLFPRAALIKNNQGGDPK